MIDRILRLATGRRAAVAVLALALGGSALFRRSPYESLKGRLGGASLPEETITSPDRLAEILGALDATGRELYLQFQLWDVLNPILMGVAGAMVLGWLLQRSERAHSPWRYAVWLPVILFAADLLENLVLSVAVAAFPGRSAIASALPLVTTAKFGAAILTVVSAVVLAGLWLRNRFSRVS